MGITKEEYIRFTQNFIERLCRGDEKIREKYGALIQWSLPPHNGFVRYSSSQLKEALNRLSEGVKDVRYQECYAALFDNGGAMVSCNFLTQIKKADALWQEHRYCAHLVFHSGKIVCLEIEPQRNLGKRLELHNLDRETRFVWEDEIIYIEVMQDHLYWNCRLDVLETTGTLSKLEETLSDFFVRIHRSYMVNKNHVRRIQKYEVNMDNGDVLQIPQRKYLIIKKKLQSPLPD